MAERYTTRVCGRSLAGIVGSNHAGGIDVCVMCCIERTNGKMQDNQDKEKVRMTYKTEYKKKIPPRACMSVFCECCVLSGREVSEKG